MSPMIKIVITASTITIAVGCLLAAVVVNEGRFAWAGFGWGLVAHAAYLETRRSWLRLRSTEREAQLYSL